MVRALIEAGATVDTQDKVSQIVYARMCILLLTLCYHSQFGQTPLYLASFCGHQKSVELLNQAGANVDIPEEVSAICKRILKTETDACTHVYHIVNIQQNPQCSVCMHELLIIH